MSFEADPRRGPRRPVLSRRRRGALAPTLAILGVLVVLVVLMSTLWTDVLWYRQLGFGSVYWTRLLTRAGLFVVGGLVMGLAVASSLLIAYRSRPVYAPVATEQASLDRYRETLEPLRKLVGAAIPAGLALFAGSAASQQWKALQLWSHSVPFGQRDPQFGIDIGFFVFTLPWLQFVSGFLTAVVFLAGLAAVVTHYLYGGLRLQGAGQRMTQTARLHLGILAAAFLLLRGVDYWLSRYDLTTKDSRLVTGLTYTDAQAVLTAKGVLSAIAVIVAILFVVAALVEGWRTLPLYGVALLVVSAILLNGIYPAAVQRFQVKPSEPSLEAKYIQRHLQATKAAYSLDKVEVTPEYTGRAQAATPQVLGSEAASIPGIRLMDPEIVGDTFRAQQSLRGYYTFPGTMDVDRYTVDGQERDTVVAVRELNLEGLQAGQRTWVIDHVEYTHGFGVVAAYGNVRTPDGSPAYFQRDLPSKGRLDPYQPRVYFGENSPQYSIVGASKNTSPREFDYPSEADNTQAKYTYTGTGGVSLGSMFNRVLYALKFREQNILLSDAVNSESRILYDRHPRDRVAKVAPYLTLDGDSYPSVVDLGDGKGKRIAWIIDGYTTSNRYPYSRLTNLQEVTSDSLTTASPNVVPLASQQVNYIRNSVKAVVDAYDGSVSLYAWDVADPVLRAWQKVFPTTLKPLSSISGDLMSHLRYPEDLFKVQRTLLARYHVNDPGVYYQNQDAWAVPTDPTEQNSSMYQPPYYLTLQTPGSDQPRYSLTSVFVPQGGSRVLSAFLAADSDAGNTTGVKREGYGKLRLLALPKNTSIPGPSQVQNRFSDPKISGELNILRQNNGSQVEYGNLLTLPFGGGLLYVQPVYVKARLSNAYPFLQKVLAVYGDNVGFANTLDEALNQVFATGGSPGSAGQPAGEAPSSSVPTPRPSGPPSPPGSASGGTAGAQAELAAALREAQTAVTASETALKAGDFAAYGEAQKRLQAAIQRAVAAEGRLKAQAAAPSAPAAAAAPGGGGSAVASVAPASRASPAA